MPNEADEGGRATSGSARKGKRQHTSPQNPLLDCSLCGKVFSSASSLSKHYLTHSQERKHVCKVCSKAFKRQDHLYVGVWSGNVCWGGLVGSGHVAVSLPPPPRSTCSTCCWVFPPPCSPGGCHLSFYSHTASTLGQGAHCSGWVTLLSPQIHTKFTHCCDLWRGPLWFKDIMAPS